MSKVFKSKKNFYRWSLLSIGRHAFLCLLLFLTLSFLFSPIAQATSTEKQFYTSLTSTYTIDTTGNTRVDHSFAIRNNTPEYFINRYSMKLGTDAIQEISVIVGESRLNPQITKDGSGIQIEIEFPDKLVGKDKVRNFRISYSHPSMAEANGWTLETFIPVMSANDPYDEHQIVLVTPLQFGHPSRIQPEGYSIKQDGQNFVLTYKNLSDEGISAIFGSQQIFKMAVRYHLDNPHSQPAITQVSLPPDTPYQKIHYHLLDPLPEEMEVDADGNWIATYYLPANDTTLVNIEASILVSLEELHPWLNKEPIKEHLTQQAFWEKDHQEIQKIASDLNSPNEIYSYTIENLEYTKEDLSNEFDRLGALGALRNPTLATCQEFTDLFIALARAKGIPARRATGYAHSNDPIMQPLSLVTDILHAWPEYYDQDEKRWIPIDPTWGNTMKGVDYFNQFDLKHVVFAYNGRSSRLPLAASNYKLPNQNSKDLEIEFEQEFPQISPDFRLNLKRKKFIGLITVPSWFELEIENLTGQAWYNGEIKITGNNSLLQTNIKNNSLTALPRQTQIIPIQIYNESHKLPQKEQAQLVFKIDNQEFIETTDILTIAPVAPNISNFISDNLNHEQQTIHPNLKITVQQAQFFLVGFIFITAFTAGSLLVFRLKKKGSLRRQSKKSKK